MNFLKNVSQTSFVTQKRIIHFLNFIRDFCSTIAKYDFIDKWKRLKWKFEIINILYSIKHENFVLFKIIAMKKLTIFLSQFKENFNIIQTLLQFIVENLIFEYFLNRHQIVNHFVSKKILYFYYAFTNNFLKRYNKNVFNHFQLFIFANIVFRLNHFIIEKTIKIIDFLFFSFQFKIANKLKVKFNHQNLDIFNNCEFI